MRDTMEEYHAQQQEKISEKLGFAAIGLFVFVALTASFIVEPNDTAEDTFGSFIGLLMVFGWGYLACYLIHKSRVSIIKREAKNLVLHYHNYGQPNTPQQAVKRPQAVQAIAQVRQSGNPEDLIKYLEKL